MSTVPTVNPIINAITQETVAFAPAVIAAMQAAEMTSASGENKKQAVLDGIVVGSKGLETSEQPNVAQIAGLVDLFASIFNSLGLFKKKQEVQ